MSWGDTYELERAVLLMLPDLEVHQRVWWVEARYKDAVGSSTGYDSFLKVDAPHLSPETIEHSRTRLDNLIRELYRLYTVIDCRERMRSYLSKCEMWFVVPMLAALILLTFGLRVYYRPYVAPQVPFLIVFAAGMLGGAVSFERRLQSLPCRGESLGDLVELDKKSGLYSSPIAGGVFAVVLYILFAANLATGTVFPTLGNPKASVETFSAFA